MKFTCHTTCDQKELTAMALEKATLEGGSTPEFRGFIEGKTGRKIQDSGG